MRIVSFGKLFSPYIPSSCHSKTNHTVDEWEENDPEDPHNWPWILKILFISSIGALTFIITFTSSAYTAAMEGVMEDFNISIIPASVGITTYVMGYGIGPMVWGPLSEVPRVGRNGMYVPAIIVFIILQVPTALVKNLPGFLILRFLGGIIGSPVLAVGAGSVVDVFDGSSLGYALGIWGCMAGLGPVFGPLVGGAAYATHGWRWTIWAAMWATTAVAVFSGLFLPETSKERLLMSRAQALRKVTGNPKWQSTAETKKLNLKSLTTTYLFRPFSMLLFEPIVLLLSLYLAVVYGLLYLFFEAFPIVFQGKYNFGPVLIGVSFMGVFVGVVVGVVFHFAFVQWKYTPAFISNGYQPPSPEIWLFHCMVSAPFIPISLFWFGWSANENSHWIVPIIGSSLFGFAIYTFFQSIISYLAQCYKDTAASAMAANDLLRSVLAAAFPLFAPSMYQSLGIGWASSVLAFISVALLPLPYIFNHFGPKIRSWSRYAY